MGKGWGLFLPPVGSLARAGASRGLCGPSLPLSFGISFLPSVLGAGGGAGVPSLVGGVQEQMGGTTLPIWAMLPPPPSPKDSLPGLPS